MKIQYDVEGGELKRSRCSSWVYQAVLYGVLVVVVVIGWVVYRQGEVLEQKNHITCQSTTPSIEELTSIVEKSHHSESTSVEITTESISTPGLIDSLLSPFVQSESVIVELTLNTDGFSIKLGETENNLTELREDSELSKLFGLQLQELLLLGHEETSGRRVYVDADSEMGPEEISSTTTASTTAETTVEEIFSWSSGNVMGFKFRYEDDHWELDVASEGRSREEEGAKELSQDSEGDP